MSIVCTDPEIADLVPGYLENRRRELPMWKSFLEAHDLEHLRVAAHNLAGSGSAYGFVELTRLGTAMMLIRRAVLEGMAAAMPELVFRPDPAERQAHGVGEIVPAFFCPYIEPDSQALLSDDYAFCRRVRDAGFRIWLAPWIRTTHAGPAIFSGTLADTVQLFSQKPDSSAE